MGDNKRKHLEFIQNVITRMNTNSFLIKGWSVTLISALFVLAAKDANAKYVLIAYFIIPIFWMLDGFFISTERKYCALFNVVSIVKEKKIDFNMKPNNGKLYRNWVSGIFSKTLIPFYGIIIFITIIIDYWILQ